MAKQNKEFDNFTNSNIYKRDHLLMKQGFSMFRVFRYLIVSISAIVIADVSYALASTSCSADCIEVKQNLINGNRDSSDAFGHFVNLTTTLETNGYKIKRVFIQRNRLRADYRSCEPKNGDIVCSFPAFNLFYGRKPDAKKGDVLTYNIRALGEHQETGESKIIKKSFSVRYFPKSKDSTVKTIHARKGIRYVKYDPGNAQLPAPAKFDSSLEGIVLDADSYNPIAGATVRVFPIISASKGSKIKALETSESGDFFLDSKVPYSFSVYVEAPGYKPFSSGILTQVKKVELQLDPISAATIAKK